MAGLLFPVPALPAGLLVGLLLRSWAVRDLRLGSDACPTDRNEESSRGRHTSHVTAAVLVVVFAVTVVNMAMSAQHVVVDRDPGVYVVTGRWLAWDGGLYVDGLEGPFATKRWLRAAGAGFYAGAPGGDLYPQFMHLLPVIIAAGQWLGGSALLLKVNAVLGGVALLAVFAFASRWLTQPFAAVATVALALNLVQVYFSRDTYSEIPMQLFLFGSLWVLWISRERSSVRLSVLAGLLLGATCMTRIDGIVYLIPLSAYLFGEALLADDGPRLPAATGAGIAVTFALAVLDTVFFARPYALDLHGQLLTAVSVLLVTVVVGGGLVLARRRVLPRVRGLLAVAQRWAVAAAVIVALVGAFGWFVRPHMEHARTSSATSDTLAAGLQRRDGLPVDPHRTYAEESLPRLGTYVGPVTLAAGIVGAGVAVAAVLRRREAGPVPFLAVVGFTTALFAWRPTITPDQIWALRRFLPQAIPGSVILAAFTAEWLWKGGPPRWSQRAWRTLSAGVLLLALAFPLHTTLPFVGHREYAPMLDLTENLCRSLGPDIAAVVVRGEHLHSILPQTLNSFCGWPVAVGPDDVPIEWYRELADEWQAEGRRLVLFSASPTPLASFPALRADPAIRAGLPVLERTLDRRPTQVITAPLMVYFASVAPSGAG
ncbi:MAG: glycosyltransferase family 39 protein [Actinobacteria bacterium]|nr:glycosyltransferase family 39 protein [Actinomycetota bacterium]